MRWILLGTCVACLPRPAAALDPYLDVGLTAEYVCYADSRRYHGAAVGVDAIYAFNDYLAIRGRYAHGEHRGKAAFRVDRFAVAGRLQLDVAHLVPWLEIAGTGYIRSGEIGPTDGLLGFAAGVGFDWLLDGGFSVGLGVHRHALAGGDGDDAPSYTDIGMRFGYRIVFGDPFAP